MTTRDYIRVMRERWRVIVSFTLVGIVVATVVFLISPAQYTAATSLYVSAQVGTDPQAAYLGAQLSEQRVKSYTELVTGGRVIRDTGQRLGLSQDEATTLGEHVAASSAIDSVVINISVTESSATRAAQIANTVGDVLSDVVDEVERPAAPGGVPQVALRIVEPAIPPVEPSSIGLPLSLVLGAVFGVALGIGAAFARNALDTTIKSADALARVTEVPTIGVIAFDPSVPRQPLAVQQSPQGPLAEAFRQLRTNLQFVDIDQPRKVLLMTSSTPMEGKTTSVANLAVVMSAAGSSVLVIEADLRRPKLSDLLGVDRSVGLTRVLSGRLQLTQATQSWGGGAFDILPSGPIPPNPSELLGSQRMVALLDEARSRYDVILLDTPPLLPVTDAAAVAPATDGVVVVCRFSKTTRSQLAGAIAALRAVSVEPVGAVLSLVPQNGPMGHSKYTTYYTSETTIAPEPVSAQPTGPTSSIVGNSGSAIEQPTVQTVSHPSVVANEPGPGGRPPPRPHVGTEPSGFTGNGIAPSPVSPESVAGPDGPRVAPRPTRRDDRR